MSKHCWDREQYRCLRGSEGAPRSDMLKEEQRLRETGNYTESEICNETPRLSGIGSGLWLSDDEIERKLWAVSSLAC